ncbi:S41 family peptidase [Eshraghiella crossota]
MYDDYEVKKSFKKGLISGIVPVLIIAVLVNILVYRNMTSKRIEVSKDTVTKINKISELIDDKYLFDYKKGDIETAIIKAYVSGLGDPYSQYYTKEEFEQIGQSAAGSYCGVGVYVTYDENGRGIKILQVIEGGPAEDAGLEEGDIITAIDGNAIVLDDFDMATSPLAGEEGTKVTVTILRNGKEKDYELTRSVIKQNYVKSRMLDNNIGYVYLAQFTASSVEQFKNAVEELKKDGAESIIFDLRDNPGGVLNGAVSILDYLLPEGLIAYVEDKYGNRKDYNSTDGTDELDIPCVVLVNENSASASELFTGALKDRGYATVVGKKTFGKGIVQSLFALGDGSGLKITVERYFTPNGVCIHGTGIEPDIEVEYDKDKFYEDGTDTQLDAAIEYLENH